MVSCIIQLCSDNPEPVLSKQAQQVSAASKFLKLSCMKYNKIVLAGGSGYLGTVLAKYFDDNIYDVVILSRTKPDVTSARWVKWNAKDTGDWVKELEGADVVINLAGRSVDCRYTPKNKAAIYSSRLDSTRVLGEAIAACKNPPALWINSSSATIYRGSYDKLMTEKNGEIGHDFSMDVCKRWEASFNAFTLPHTRKVILRIAVVLGRSGGALPVLMRLAKCGLGGRHGSGDQFFSWIHEKDFCRAVKFVIDNRHAEGIYNVSAPAPIPNREFMKKLQNVCKAPFAINQPEWLLSLGAIFIRTETELLLKSRKVYPERLLDEHFVFEFTDAKAAFEDLCRIEARKNRNFILSR
jgi:hypothetical protein